MKEEDAPITASLSKNYHKINKQLPRSCCLLDRWGTIHLFLNQESLFFLTLKNEEEIRKKFHEKPRTCIIMAN